MGSVEDLGPAGYLVRIRTLQLEGNVTMSCPALTQQSGAQLDNVGSRFYSSRPPPRRPISHNQSPLLG